MQILKELKTITLIIKPSVIKVLDGSNSAQVKSAILFASLFSKEAIIKELDVSRNHTETMFDILIFQLKRKGLSITTTLKQFDTLNLQIFMFLAIFHLQRSLLLQLITPGSDVTIHNVGINQHVRYY